MMAPITDLELKAALEQVIVEVVVVVGGEGGMVVDSGGGGGGGGGYAQRLGSEELKGEIAISTTTPLVCTTSTMHYISGYCHRRRLPKGNQIKSCKLKMRRWT